MSDRNLHTEEERHAKYRTKMFLQRVDGLKSVVVDGIKITVKNGSLKTDWQLEQDDREAKVKDQARLDAIVENTRSSCSLSGLLDGVESIEIDEMTLENRDGELVVVDTD